jgi:hypothetical protein
MAPQHDTTRECNSNESQRLLFMILVLYDDKDLDISSLEEGLTEKNPRIGVIPKLLVPTGFINSDGDLDTVKIKKETVHLGRRIDDSPSIKATGYKESYLPVIFIGIGAGAVVTMQYLTQNTKVVPMGVVLISVPFQSLIQVQGGKGANLLKAINGRCRSERIRFSCMARRDLKVEESSPNVAYFY